MGLEVQIQRVRRGGWGLGAKQHTGRTKSPFLKQSGVHSDVAGLSCHAGSYWGSRGAAGSAEGCVKGMLKFSPVGLGHGVSFWDIAICVGFCLYADQKRCDQSVEQHGHYAMHLEGQRQTGYSGERRWASSRQCRAPSQGPLRRTPGDSRDGLQMRSWTHSSKYGTWESEKECWQQSHWHSWH